MVLKVITLEINVRY